MYAEPFWRPKNWHNLMMPDSISVCLTIACESVSKYDTVCWSISCSAPISVSKRTACFSASLKCCVCSRKRTDVSASTAKDDDTCLVNYIRYITQTHTLTNVLGVRNAHHQRAVRCQGGNGRQHVFREHICVATLHLGHMQQAFGERVECHDSNSGCWIVC